MRGLRGLYHRGSAVTLLFLNRFMGQSLLNKYISHQGTEGYIYRANRSHS